MRKWKAILFDADGVLLDSLPAHLKICNDLSRGYGLNLRIPSPAEFKERVRAGTRVSPMECFFLAVGFPSDLAKKADTKYKETFAQTYEYGPFPGVHEMLKGLHDDGYLLGIVTSNVKANVLAKLGDAAHFFQSNCIYSKDVTGDAPKSDAIASAMATLNVDPRETIYVGDQVADWQAATKAGVDFLGVAYGWGLPSDADNLSVVEDVAGICAFISSKG